MQDLGAICRRKEILDGKLAAIEVRLQQERARLMLPLRDEIEEAKAGEAVLIKEARAAGGKLNVESWRLVFTDAYARLTPRYALIVEKIVGASWLNAQDADRLTRYLKNLKAQPTLCSVANIDAKLTIKKKGD